LATKTSKYRVTYRGFSEYVNTGDHLTNVHSILECDVVAVDGVEALALAAKAFGVLESGDWKVRMLRSPQDVEFVGSSPDRSTIVSATRMGA